MKLQFPFTICMILFSLVVVDVTARPRHRRTKSVLKSEARIAEKQFQALVRYPENTRDSSKKRESFLKADRVPAEQWSYSHCLAGAKRHAKSLIQLSWRTRWSLGQAFSFSDPESIKSTCSNEARLIEKLRKMGIPIYDVLPALTPEQELLWQQAYKAASAEANNGKSAELLKNIGRMILIPHDESMYLKALKLANGIKDQQLHRKSMNLLFTAPLFDLASMAKKNPGLLQIYPDLYVLDASRKSLKSVKELVALLRAAPTRKALVKAIESMSTDTLEKPFVSQTLIDESISWAWRLPLARRVVQCLNHSDFVSKILLSKPGKFNALRLAFLESTDQPGICVVKLKDVLQIVVRDSEDPEIRAAGAVDLQRRLEFFRSDIADLDEDEQRKTRGIESTIAKLEKLASSKEAFRIAWQNRKHPPTKPPGDNQQTVAELCKGYWYVTARKALLRNDLDIRIRKAYETVVRETDRQLLRLILIDTYEALKVSKPKSFPEEMKTKLTFGGKPCLYLPSGWGLKNAMIALAPMTMLDEDGTGSVLYVVNSDGIVAAISPDNAKALYLKTREGRRDPRLIDQVIGGKYNVSGQPPVRL